MVPLPSTVLQKKHEGLGQVPGVSPPASITTGTTTWSQSTPLISHLHAEGLIDDLIPKRLYILKPLRVSI